MASMVPYRRHNSLSRWPFDAFDDFFEAPMATLSREQQSFKMDVEDCGDAYQVSAELPGVTRDMIDVELNEGRLSISVDKKESDEKKAKNYLYKETREWSATRGVYLKDAAIEGLSAKLEDGVLSVNIPKLQEQTNVTKINID